MRITLFFAAALAFVGTMKAQNTSFEASEGYNLGPINGQNGWAVSSLFSNMFTVNNAQASDGQYSLKLDIDQTGWLPGGNVIGPTRNISSQVPLNPNNYEISADLYFTSTTTPQSEIDFYVYGAAGTEAMPSSIMALANGFVRIIEMSDLTLATTVVVPNDVFTNLKVKFDFVNQQTLHYVNNELVYTGPLNLSKVTGYGFLTTGRTVGYVDNILTTANSLGTPKADQNHFSYYVSQNQLILQSPNFKSNIEIFNVSGQKVLSQALNATDETIELDAFSAGVYLAKLNVQGETQTFKFIR